VFHVTGVQTCALPISEIRGKGLMVGIQLTCDAQKVLAGCRDRGLLANVTSGSVLRLLPPLIVTEEEIRQSVEIFGQAIEDAVARSEERRVGKGWRGRR